MDISDYFKLKYDRLLVVINGNYISDNYISGYWWLFY